LGITAVIRPIPFKTSLNFEIIMVIITSSLLLLVVKITGKKKNTITRLEGLFLIAAYIGFLIFNAFGREWLQHF
jgi:Ca2+/Na+ antiporter